MSNLWGDPEKAPIERRAPFLERLPTWALALLVLGLIGLITLALFLTSRPSPQIRG